MNSYSQLDMIHRLPPATLVDRFKYLRDLAAGRRVIHVGFADAGFQTLNEESGAWLHAHLATTARELVGLDVDDDGVARAVAKGYDARVVDCCDVDAVRALALEPAEVLVAGEVIEHLDDVGSFLDALHTLVTADGILAITTPNAAGLVNTVASFANYEVNHPDHVTMFTCRTLDAMLRRHRWDPIEHRVFVQQVKTKAGASPRSAALTTAARALLGLERLLARVGLPYTADGLIVLARPAA